MWINLRAIILIAIIIPPIDLSAKEPSVIVKIGQPNIWSLEQAHYLLAKTRSATAALKTRVPSESDLDPNAISGTQYDVLKTFLGISGTYDTPLGTKNRIALDRYEQDSNR